MTPTQKQKLFDVMSGHSIRCGVKSIDDDLDALAWEDINLIAPLVDEWITEALQTASGDFRMPPLVGNHNLAIGAMPDGPEELHIEIKISDRQLAFNIPRKYALDFAQFITIQAMKP